MSKLQGPSGVVGVYRIWHVVDQVYYVGQSSDIGARIRSHVEQLTQSRHHNPGLQACWSRHNGQGFQCEVVERATSSTLNLALERWLADREEAEIQRLRQLGKHVTNVAPSQVVESVLALKEYQEEVKSANSRITHAKKLLKEKAQQIQREIDGMSPRLHEIRFQKQQLEACVRQNTGFLRSLLNAGPNEIGRKAAVTLKTVSEHLVAYENIVQSLNERLHALEQQMRLLHSQYHGVAKQQGQRQRRFLPWMSRGNPPWESVISRRPRRILGLPETFCRISGALVCPSSEVVVFFMHDHTSSTPIGWRISLPYEFHCYKVVALEVTHFFESTAIHIEHAGHSVLRVRAGSSYPKIRFNISRSGIDCEASEG